MKFLRWIDTLSRFGAVVGTYFILALVVVICFDVLMRYALGSPTTWAYDTALHLYSISFLLGGAWVLGMKAHVKVDVIYNKCSPRTRAVINLLFYLFFLFPVCYYLLKDGTLYAYTSWKVGEVSRSSPLHEPIWPLKAFIPISFLLLILQGIVEFVRDWVKATKGNSN